MQYVAKIYFKTVSGAFFVNLSFENVKLSSRAKRIEEGSNSSANSIADLSGICIGHVSIVLAQNVFDIYAVQNEFLCCVSVAHLHVNGSGSRFACCRFVIIKRDNVFISGFISDYQTCGVLVAVFFKRDVGCNVNRILLFRIAVRRIDSQKSAEFQVVDVFVGNGVFYGSVEEVNHFFIRNFLPILTAYEGGKSEAENHNCYQKTNNNFLVLHNLITS